MPAIAVMPATEKAVMLETAVKSKTAMMLATARDDGSVDAGNRL
jgi:hypothetical protein